MRPPVAEVGTEPNILERYRPSRVDWDTLWQRDRTEAEWLVEPILPRGRATSTYSAPKVGKSLLSLDVAARLAIGGRIFDRPPGDPVDVLYVDLEMTEGDLFERLQDMGYGPEVDLSRLHYQLLPDLPPLDTAAGGQDLRDLASAHGAELVIVDTTTSATTGAENDADTIRAYWQHTGRVLKADGRTVWRLDHAGKDSDRGQRGSSAKAGDVDLVWELSEQEDETLRLRATHRRLGWVPKRLGLVRLEEPLRHEIARETYAAGTYELAEKLDALGVPIEAGRPTVRQALRDAGHGARNHVLSDAIRYRKERAETLGTGPGTGPGADLEDSDSGQGERPASDQRGQVSGTGRDRGSRRTGDRSLPLKEGPLSPSLSRNGFDPKPEQLLSLADDLGRPRVELGGGASVPGGESWDAFADGARPEERRRAWAALVEIHEREGQP